MLWIRYKCRFPSPLCPSLCLENCRRPGRSPGSTLYSQQKKKKIQLMGGLCRLFHTCSAFSPSTLFVIHLYRGRQVPLKHHILFRGSSPSEPNEHVEIQWILICCYIGTRDKSAREDLLGGNWKERAALLDFPCIPSETAKKGTMGEETINFGDGNLLLFNGWRGA